MLSPHLRGRLVAAGLLVGSAGAVLCAAVPHAAAQGGQASVGIYDNQFIPREVVVPLGGTVVWTAYGGPHNVVADGQLWSSALLGRAAAFERVFDQPGQYRYTCTLHPGMNGTVIALGPGGSIPGSAPSVARSASPPRLRIVEPVDGAALAADQVRVRVEVDDFDLDSRGIGAAGAAGGHWHLSVDGARLQVLVGEDAVLPPLAPGQHTLEAQLRQHDHGRVEGSNPARVTVTLLPDDAVPAPEAPGAGLPPLLAAAAVALYAWGVTLANRRRAPAASKPQRPLI